MAAADRLGPLPDHGDHGRRAQSGRQSTDHHVTDAQGKPSREPKLTTTVAMTSMDMGTTHPAVTEKGGGQYAATVTFGMAGPWRVTLCVTAPGP